MGKNSQRCFINTMDDVAYGRIAEIPGNVINFRVWLVSEVRCMSGGVQFRAFSGHYFHRPLVTYCPRPRTSPISLDFTRQHRPCPRLIPVFCIFFAHLNGPARTRQRGPPARRRDPLPPWGKGPPPAPSVRLRTNLPSGPAETSPAQPPSAT